MTRPPATLRPDFLGSAVKLRFQTNEAARALEENVGPFSRVPEVAEQKAAVDVAATIR